MKMLRRVRLPTAGSWSLGKSWSVDFFLYASRMETGSRGPVAYSSSWTDSHVMSGSWSRHVPWSIR